MVGVASALWDPAKHPRQRGGRFGEVLGALHANGHHSLLHGTRIEKSLLGWKVHSPGAESKHFVGGDGAAERAVNHALTVDAHRGNELQARHVGRRSSLDIAQHQRAADALGLFHPGGERVTMERSEPGGGYVRGYRPVAPVSDTAALLVKHDASGEPIGWSVAGSSDWLTRELSQVKAHLATNPERRPLPPDEYMPPPGKAVGLYSPGGERGGLADTGVLGPGFAAELAARERETDAAVASFRARKAASEEMITRRVAGGHTEAQSRELLAQIQSQHGPGTIDAALAYHGFTGRGAASPGGERTLGRKPSPPITYRAGMLGPGSRHIADRRKIGSSGFEQWQGDRLEGIKQIVARHQAMEIDGHLVDAQTASLLVKVHDALKPANKAKFGTVSLPRLVDLAWQSVR
jgi:hypothetical protein